MLSHAAVTCLLMTTSKWPLTMARNPAKPVQTLTSVYLRAGHMRLSKYDLYITCAVMSTILRSVMWVCGELKDNQTIVSYANQPEKYEAEESIKRPTLACNRIIRSAISKLEGTKCAIRLGKHCVVYWRANWCWLQNQTAIAALGQLLQHCQ